MNLNQKPVECVNVYADSLRKCIRLLTFVRVVIEAKLEGTGKEVIKIAADSLKLQIQGLGGKIETSYNQLIQTQVPIGSILTFADISSVRYLRLPRKPIILETSEGVVKTGANQWHNLPSYHSDGAKVCILDLGFKGYEDLLGSELPSTVNARSFRYHGGMYDISDQSVHGTACAEVVHDMAPNAELWLVFFKTNVELANAVDWIINQKIDILSASFGGHYSAGNGTGLYCELVKKAVDSGIVWVNAAGNAAEHHWEGYFNDPDNDGWHNFSGQDEIFYFDLLAYHAVDVFLKWNDWGWWNGYSYSGSNQDYDLYLYYKNGANWEYVDKSTNWQTGFQDPVEAVLNWYSPTKSRWGIAIRKKSASKNVRFDLFINTHKGPIEYNIPTRSLSTPADSPYAIAVGATDWTDDSYHPYSSQGPTADGRIKPDICAPSAVSTESYGDPFSGTSAACPHVAGAFALLKGKTPLSLVQIKAYLEAFAIDLGPGGKDNKFGKGRLNLLKK